MKIRVILFFTLTILDSTLYEDIVSNLIEKEMNDEDIAKIIGGNFIRIMEQVSDISTLLNFESFFPYNCTQ